LAPHGISGIETMSFPWLGHWLSAQETELSNADQESWLRKMSA
jgi:hypothetical protein